MACKWTNYRCEALPSDIRLWETTKVEKKGGIQKGFGRAGATYQPINVVAACSTIFRDTATSDSSSPGRSDSGKLIWGTLPVFRAGANAA